MFPKPRGDKLAEEPFVSEHLLDLGDPLHRLRVVEIGRHDVVIVKLHAIKAELLVLANLGGKLHVLADLGAERIAARRDIPGAEGKAVFGRHRRFSGL